MRIAYVLQTFRALDQIRKLVSALKRDRTDNVIVVSHNGPPDELAALRAMVGVDHVIPSPGGRARFTVIDGLISTMRWLENSEAGFDWLVVLSGQDYPIRPLPELATRLGETEYDAHFYHFDALDPVQARSGPMSWPPREVKNRYLFRYALLKPFTSPTERMIYKIPRHLLELTDNYRLESGYGLCWGRKPDKTPFGPDFSLIGGSYWMTINRRCVKALLDFVDERPDITAYFRDLIAPEEAFIQSVLVNDKRLNISPTELRYFDFMNSEHGRPKTFGGDDIEMLRESGCYFARKFDETENPGILELVDSKLL
ncbi:beta-1,6-N-acetylglucosaminyltransferase [Bosea sp. PAMC 26642]|uniref:beta-1,6-N-acetylglucosaminyltransferase n=1 Tax=Bosea sp. (strain PAMC 26642) TaxID=1792307 RepID=UPI000770088D|nr:beta-1,6-N-acetylglucosaminyltransferase [Bosea sp. PAMC 26642]AMJ62545.1 hypothetical protein AXW83_21545 [Bosea sp. PAMC 26642]